MQPALMGLFGVACIVLGFGSGLMHAAMMPLGHKLDVFGMFTPWPHASWCNGHAGSPLCPSRTAVGPRGLFSESSPVLITLTHN
jgi:hypothetical protein